MKKWTEELDQKIISLLKYKTAKQAAASIGWTEGNVKAYIRRMRRRGIEIHSEFGIKKRNEQSSIRQKGKAPYNKVPVGGAVTRGDGRRYLKCEDGRFRLENPVNNTKKVGEIVTRKWRGYDRRAIKLANGNWKYIDPIPQEAKLYNKPKNKKRKITSAIRRSRKQERNLKQKLHTDISNKVPVRLDRKTIIYVDPGYDIKHLREKYKIFINPSNR